MTSREIYEVQKILFKILIYSMFFQGCATGINIRLQPRLIADGLVR